MKEGREGGREEEGRKEGRKEGREGRGRDYKAKKNA
jgi:hypothetical protein